MHFNRVVIAVDFSAASLAAARWVAMQVAPRAELALVHVVSEPAAPSFVRPFLPPFEEAAAELAPALNGALKGLAGVVGSDRTTIKLLFGTPADALATFAHEFGADLISLGRRRRRRGAARFGDTTAQRLLARTRIPVLVVPTARPTLPARVLVAVDEQPDTIVQLRAAWGMARTYEAALEVLHVLAPELPRLVALGLAQSDTGKARLESLTHDWLASQVRQAGEDMRRVTLHVRVGDPGEQIVKLVHATGADLVLVGRGGDERAGVTGRMVFYNNSAFDGAGDDNAIAQDKSARMPGQVGSFANIIGFTKGINGVMADVAVIPGQTLSPSDFTFKAGTEANPANWAAAPAPQSVTVRKGAGVNGSDRIVLVWSDNSIRNQWLQVTLLANASTNLAAPSVFYFGNLVGDTGDSPLRVNALDLGVVKAALNRTAPIDGKQDVNHDGRVNALDLGAIKANLNRVLVAVAGAATADAMPAAFGDSGVAPGASNLSDGESVRRVWDEAPVGPLP